MNREKIIKLAKITNIVLIITTVIVFLVFTIANYFIANWYNSASYYTVTSTAATIEIVVLWIYRIISVASLALSIVLISQAKGKVEGLSLLVASAAISTVFSILGLMLGIIIWITSGISLNKLSKTASDDRFKDQLDGKNEDENYNF